MFTSQLLPVVALKLKAPDPLFDDWSLICVSAAFSTNMLYQARSYGKPELVSLLGKLFCQDIHEASTAVIEIRDQLHSLIPWEDKSLAATPEPGHLAHAGSNGQDCHPAQCEEKQDRHCQHEVR